MADISSITLPGGGTYDLKDKNAVPKYGMGKNLLRNWYFVGGGTGRGVFPVNQRGMASYSNATYTVDGWKIRQNGNSLQVNSSNVTFYKGSTYAQCDFHQFIDTATLARLLGKRVTATILWDSTHLDTVTFTWASTNPAVISGTEWTLFCGGTTSVFTNFCIRCSATSLSVQAVKLELGTEQTLAHQENDTWVLNEIPDYEEELIKCQTSTADSSDTYANKSLATEQQLAYVETGTTASRAYSTGEYFCWNGLLYRATAAISSGGTFTPGTNCVQTTLASQIRLATATWTTGSGGTVSTGLNVSTAKILSAFAIGYDISVYLNSSGVQGYFVKTAGTNTPASNVTISVTAVILNY